MSDHSNGAALDLNAAPKAAQIFEFVIRWNPATGELSTGSNAPDPVAQLGMLEMAKVALIEQRAAAASGKGPSVIVPGRFRA